MTLSLILRKLELARGPDEKLGEEIHAALLPDHYFAQLADAPAGCGCMMYTWPDGTVSSALRITASMDAAVGMVEKMLPGWVWAIESDGVAVIREPGTSYIGDDLAGPGASGGATPALALCIALLKALEAARPLEAREG